MRGDHNVVAVQERVIGRQRLRIGHVQPGSGDVAGLEGCEEGVVIHQ